MLLSSHTIARVPKQKTWLRAYSAYQIDVRWTEARQVLSYAACLGLTQVRVENDN